MTIHARHVVGGTAYLAANLAAAAAKEGTPHSDDLVQTLTHLVQGNRVTASAARAFFPQQHAILGKNTYVLSRYTGNQRH